MEQPIVDTDCEGFFRLITDAFGEELDRGIFSIVKSLSARSGEQCLLIMATQYYQLKFIADRGTLESLIGSSDAIRGWENFVNGEPQWYGLHNLVDAINGIERPSLERLAERGRRRFGTPLPHLVAIDVGLVKQYHADLQQAFHRGLLQNPLLPLL